ncbi:MAG: TolC family protein [Bacteroidaceae bacterium]|nr:TolC family protein [Bacteroidaceae bacterium]
MKRIILSSALIFTVFATYAQEQVFTLSKCLEIGLENNYSLRITRNEEQISKNNVTLANAGFLPTLDLSAGYDAQLNSNNSELRGTSDIQKTRNAFDQTANAGLDLNWTIFNGFSVSTNYKQLKELERMGETNTRIALEDFIAGMAAEYYNFLQQRLRLNNYYNAVLLSKERLRIVEERYNIGNFSRLDYQQAKVDFNADSAQYMKQQEVVITSRIALNEMMAIDQVYTPIETVEKVIIINDTLDFVDLWHCTLGNNATLLLAGQNNTLAQFDYKKVLSRNYPYVKFKAGYDYGFNKYGNNSTVRRHAWGGNAGISIGFTLWNGNRRREMRNAKIAMENVKLTRDKLELSLKADLGNLWQAYQNNLELLNLEKTNVITARENHEIAKERYMLGDLSGIEMREAQQSLLDAEERLLAVEYDTKLCEISLMQISGKITELLK